MAYFRHNNLEVYFEENGSGSPLIFSHGLGGNLAQVRELIGDLPKVRLILYDNRGHGRTSALGDPKKLNFFAMADDMAALLDRLDIPAAIVGGVSMGAGIALAFSARHRGRARALILSRPAWLNFPNPPNLSIFPTIADMVEEHGREQALRLFENSDLYKSWKHTYPETARSLSGLFSNRSIDAIVLSFRSIPASAPFSSFDELRQIDVPTLVLGNRNDPIHPFEYAKRLADSIPSAQLREFPSKSDSLEEHQSKFRSFVAEFLSTVI